MTTATLTAGIPSKNAILYHAIRFNVGDPAALIEIAGKGRTLILREIEMDRAKQHARADKVLGYADVAPASGLSGDRETGSAQGVVEFLRRNRITRVVTDRSLPFIYAHHIQSAGIALDYDPDKGVLNRRAKDEQEVSHLAKAQRDTETVMERACRLIARAPADRAGVLQHDGAPLTAERMRSMIDIWLLEIGYANPDAIVAPGPEGGDCHNHGHGPIRTGQSVIVDIFPLNKTTLYNGDCTRTVVHGEVSDAIRAMHDAVVEAKAAAIAATRAGVTGEQVHGRYPPARPHRPRLPHGPARRRRPGRPDLHAPRHRPRHRPRGPRAPAPRPRRPRTGRRRRPHDRAGPVLQGPRRCPS